MDEIMDKCQYQGKIGEPRVGCDQHWEYSWQPDKTYRPIMLCCWPGWTLEDLVEYADCQGLVDGDHYLAAVAAIENIGGLLDQIRYISKTRGVSLAKSAIDDAARRKRANTNIEEIMTKLGVFG
jgi:hypothetical protein